MKDMRSCGRQGEGKRFLVKTRGMGEDMDLDEECKRQRVCEE